MHIGYSLKAILKTKITKEHSSQPKVLNLPKKSVIEQSAKRQ